MKIAIISTDALPANKGTRYAGLEVMCYNLSKELARLNYDVTLFALQGSEKPEGVNLITFASVNELMDKHIDFFKQDDLVVSDHSWHKVSWALKQKIPGLKFTAHHHGPHIGYDSPKLEYLNLVGLSHFHARMMQAEINRPVQYLYNGIDLDLYPLYDGKRNDHMLFVNRLHPEKGAHYAIDIAKQFNMVLDIVGVETPNICPPDYVRAIIQRCDGKQIRYWGDPGIETKVELMQHSQFLFHPIVDFNEPFGLSVIEAMACGTPVIAFNRGAMGEIIQEGGALISNFTQFPYADALKLISRKSVKMCHNNAKLFSVQNMAHNYDSLLRHVYAGMEW